MKQSVLTVADLRVIAPNAKSSIIRGIVKSFHVLAEYGIADNKLRLAHFLAQAALETAGFRTLNEYGSASYFRRRYGRRKDLGNRNASDGARYHGRGIFQLTGRYNYRHYGKLINVDLEHKPYLAARPDISLRIACVYWNSKKLSRYADADNIRKITKRINGGYNGLRGRRRYLAKAKRILADKLFPSDRPIDLNRPIDKDKPGFGIFRRVLKRGMFGAAVQKMQHRLNNSGFQIIEDGVFGSLTRKAVMGFQKKMRLRIDGLVGLNTWQKLGSYQAEKSYFRAKFSLSSRPFLKGNIKRNIEMTQWKSYLESRTLWSNLIGLVALFAGAFGFSAISEHEQSALIDSILKLIEAFSFVAGAFFRYIASEKLS